MARRGTRPRTVDNSVSPPLLGHHHPPAVQSRRIRRAAALEQQVRPTIQFARRRRPRRPGHFNGNCRTFTAGSPRTSSRPFKPVLTGKWSSSARCTGARAEKCSGLLGLPFVLAMNTNAVGLVQQLHRDANLRQVVSAGAAVAAESDLNSVTAKYCTPPTPTSPQPSPAIDADPAREPKPPTVQDVRDELRCAVQILSAADELELVPNWASRWNASASTRRTGCCRLWRFAQSTVRSTVADFGWVGRPITSIALSFGAQFWFDILRRLLGLRNRSGAAG